MFVITVQRKDGFLSETADKEEAAAESRWSGLIEAACRTAEDRRLTARLSMFTVDAPTEPAAIAAVRAGMGLKVKGVQVLPPKALTHKVTQSGPDAITDAVLDRAQAVIDAEAESYPDEAMADLRALQAIVDAMTAAGAVAPEMLDQLQRVAYKVKAHGGTFGYPLLTTVAHHLYVMSRALKLADRRMIDAIQVHIDTMRFILGRRLTGMPEDSRQIINRLHEVVVKMVGEPEE